MGSEISIIKENCTQCKLCEKVCVRKVIDVENYSINHDNCIQCTHCYSICWNNAIEIKNFKRTKLTPYQIAGDDFKNMVLARRSIRVYDDKEPEDTLLQKIAGLAKYSPTASNSQPVHVTIIKGKQKIEKLGKSIMQHYDKKTSKINNFNFPLYKMMMGKKLAQKLMGIKNVVKLYKNGTNVFTLDAPVCLIFHAPASVMPAHDCIGAATVTMLYAESLGLGTCLNGYLIYAVKDNKKLKQELNIPENHTIHSSYMLGYYGINYKYLVKRENKDIPIYK